MGNSNSILLEGQVCNGLGKGAAFIKLDGYQQQFVNRLGYEPYPGTLNIEILDGDQNTIDETTDPIVIDGWTDGDIEYGPVHSFPAVLQTDNGADQVHVIRPLRTRHEEDILELIAPYQLRDRFNLDTGDQVKVVVKQQSES